MSSEKETITTQVFDKIKFDVNGLLPAVIQDEETKEVIMLGYMNKDSLLATVKTKKTNFWSRSRQKYWIKGESSGHIQEVKEIFFDCDLDTVVIKVKQHGGACHVGYKSCFYRKLKNEAGDVEIIGEKVFDPEAVYKK
ncbi:phosphoribosyl-AMP cyclohydrolase [Candidatus Auribacterota bacterium]